MIVYLPLTIITIALALFVSKRPADAYSGIARSAQTYRGIMRQELLDGICLFGIFISLFLVSALRVNVGNDYMRYVEFMHRADVGAYVATEWSFNQLTRLIYFISGFENYLAVFAVFAFFTIVLFMAGIRRESEDFPMSFILFMLLGYYFQSISTVRQYLALAVAMFSLRFILTPVSVPSASDKTRPVSSRNWLRFVVLILAGSLFHKSLLLVLVFYPLCLIRWRRWMFLVFSLLCLSSLLFHDLYLDIAVFLYPSYAESGFLSGGTSFVPIARCMAVLGLHVIVTRGHPLRTETIKPAAPDGVSMGADPVPASRAVSEDPHLRFYFMCNLLGLALYTFGSFLPTVSRIAYYLTVTQILYIPALLLRISDELRRRVLYVSVILAAVLYFIMYMYHAGDIGIRVLPYQSILFHDLPPTLSESSGGAM